MGSFTATAYLTAEVGHQLWRKYAGLIGSENGVSSGCVAGISLSSGEPGGTGKRTHDTRAQLLDC